MMNNIITTFSVVMTILRDYGLIQRPMDRELPALAAIGFGKVSLTFNINMSPEDVRIAIFRYVFSNLFFK